LDGIVHDIANVQAAASRIKDNIAASWEAALTRFEQLYTKYNKRLAIVLSFVVVLALNANIIILYDQISVDQVAQQAITGAAVAPSADQTPRGGGDQAKQTDLETVYSHSREKISAVIQKYPILIRTTKYKDDFKRQPFCTVFGLLIMGTFVSLGAPFWNDILKGIKSVNVR
jgi:hypothetical protein